MKRLILPVGIALAFAGVARADFNPIPLTSDSFNFDLIVEHTGPPPLTPGGQPGAPTTASMDGGIGNGGDTWNEQGYFRDRPDVGLPPAGTTFNANWDAGHTYTLASSYAANDAIMLDVGFFTNANWTPTTPRAYATLSFLTSGGNGGAQFSYTAQHQDGTAETGVTNSADWFNVPDHIAWIANGRCGAQSFAKDNFDSNNPRLYSIDVALTGSSSPITNINIKYVGGNASGHSCIMAISGTPVGGTPGVYSPIPGTGYTADIVIEAAYPERWDYTLTNAPVNATMDGGTNVDATTLRLTGDTWFEAGYYTPSNSVGLPAAGSTFSSTDQADHHYTMPASYATNDAVMLDNSNTTAKITFATPSAHSALSLLGASGGGACNIQVTVNFNDASTESHTVALPDWFGNSPVALHVNGRLNAGTGLLDNLNGGDPRIYAVDFALNNTVTPVASLSLTYTSGGRGSIFAVSGAAGAVAPLFTIQPQTAGVTEGSPASFSASVSGTAPITLQWEKGTNGVWVNLTGQTGSTLNIASASPGDEADYRLVAANVAGSATSVVASLTVLSTLPRITAPTDPITAYQPLGGSSPAAEVVTHAIDDLTSKYLNFGHGSPPFGGPVGFVVTPALGRSFLKVMRLYTANDAPERDPANYILEGSNDGGGTWALIASNTIAMPDARNAAGTAIDPTTNALRQVRLVNTNSYSVFRWSVTHVKNDAIANSMQIGEVELLGTQDTTGFPEITTAPTNTEALVGDPASFSVAATGTPAPTFQWLRGNTPLTDGGTISGATTPTLTINPAEFSDVADYKVVVANSLATITSAPAHLTVVSRLTDFTQPADPITGYGDASGTLYGTLTNASNTIDNTFTKWQNGGHGFSAPAGFPPFVGPVGVIVTPGVGSTLLQGIRIYTADGNPERDPADVEIFGSNDGGTTFTPIFSSALNLPQDRTSAANPVTPINFDGTFNPMQELLFGNSQAYTTYKVQFTHTRDDNTASSLQIGELELLGSAGVPLGLSFSGGQLTLTWSQGTLLEATNLGGPWVTNSAPSPLVVTPTGPQKFYRLILQ